MEISNPRYILIQGHPCLEVFLDGHRNIISAEIKPTLLRHGFIPVQPENASPNAIVLDTPLEASNDDRLFRLFVAFGLECYHHRFQPGAPVETIDPLELKALGDRLEPYTSSQAPSWAELTKNF
jgi:hypothetical protein